MNRPDSGRSLKKFFETELKKIDEPEEAEAIAIWAVQELTGFTKTDIIADKPLVITDARWERITSVLERLKSQEPVQHIFGRTWFRGKEYKISESVLIPRSETEELVQKILDDHGDSKLEVVDIGSGSGCIAISLKLERPDWEVHSCDVSPEALLVSRKNATYLAADVRFQELDILRMDLPGDFDIIVSNPPYIPQDERKDLRKRVKLFEPGIALFVPADDPLLYYRRIAEVAISHLNSGGSLYFEIEEKRGNEITSMLQSSGWQRVNLYQDINGKDRIVVARLL